MHTCQYVCRRSGFRVLPLTAAVLAIRTATHGNMNKEPSICETELYGFRTLWKCSPDLSRAFKRRRHTTLYTLHLLEYSILGIACMLRLRDVKDLLHPPMTTQPSVNESSCGLGLNFKLKELVSPSLLSYTINMLPRNLTPTAQIFICNGP